MIQILQLLQALPQQATIFVITMLIMIFLFTRIVYGIASDIISKHRNMKHSAFVWGLFLGVTGIIVTAIRPCDECMKKDKPE